MAVFDLISNAMADEGAKGVVAKIGSVWAMVGITSWADFSYFIASAYTACLFGHWIWKILLKPKKRG